LRPILKDGFCVKIFHCSSGGRTFDVSKGTTITRDFQGSLPRTGAKRGNCLHVGQFF
jgi:hypothetical protein